MVNQLVLIVDDDIYMYALMKTVLEGSYEIHYAKNGEACLESIGRHKPQLVLLDIEMAGINGYEVCRRIKAADALDPPSVIFVSAHCTPEDRLAAYAAGADDFITKPLAPEELYRKVEQIMKNRQEMENLRLSAHQAMGVAMSAMSDTGALGNVILLFRRLFTVTSHEELAQLLLDEASEHGLSATVQIRHAGEKYTINSEGRSSMMESVLLDNLGSEGKTIVDYGARTVFNFGAVSLLIKNMPPDEPEPQGKFKDQLALLVETAAERVKALSVASMQASLGVIHSELSDIEQRCRTQGAQCQAVVGDMIKEMHDAMIFLSLTDRQESVIMGVINKASERIVEIAGGGELDACLLRALGRLDAAKH